jgi:Lar family restriction alleviation protein
MQEKKMEELKKCPFCGGEAKIVGYSLFWIVCKECFAETDAFDTKIEAIKAWNRRVNDE